MQSYVKLVCESTPQSFRVQECARAEHLLARETRQLLGDQSQHIHGIGNQDDDRVGVEGLHAVKNALENGLVAANELNKMVGQRRCQILVKTTNALLLTSMRVSPSFCLAPAVT